MITHTNKNMKGVGFIIRLNILPPTSQKVFLSTDPLVNAEIKKQTIKNLNIYKNCSKEELTDRIRQLCQEWDIERVMEVGASISLILSSLLGVRLKRLGFILTGAIGLFMLQHALHGWCPPLPIVRKWGIRTAEEIANEKTVLKVMRGDFTEKELSVEELLKMAEMN